MQAMPIVERAHQPRRWHGLRLSRAGFAELVRSTAETVATEAGSEPRFQIVVEEYERPFESPDEFLENVEDREWVDLDEIQAFITASVSKRRRRRARGFDPDSEGEWRADDPQRCRPTFPECDRARSRRDDRAQRHDSRGRDCAIHVALLCGRSCACGAMCRLLRTGDQRCIAAQLVERSGLLRGRMACAQPHLHMLRRPLAHGG